MPSSDDFSLERFDPLPPIPTDPRPASPPPGTSMLRHAANAFCNAIDQDLPLLVHDFARIASRGTWRVVPILPPRTLLSRLIRLVAILALGDGSRPRIRELILVAADFGFARFEQDLTEISLLYDFDVLRQTLWYYIRDRSDPTGPFPLEAIIRVDHVLTLAAPAALRGFHRLAFEARGEWPAVLTRLEREWTPPPPVI